jgi:hypothetical protein
MLARTQRKPKALKAPPRPKEGEWFAYFLSGPGTKELPTIGKGLCEPDTDFVILRRGTPGISGEANVAELTLAVICAHGDHYPRFRERYGLRVGKFISANTVFTGDGRLTLGLE